MAATLVGDTDEQARLVQSARAMVVQDPGILGGSMPVIRGTRVPVYDIAAAVAAGSTCDEILVSYPSLTPDQVKLAALYAQLEPPSARPRRRVAERLPAGARVVASGTVPRRAVTPPQRPRTSPD